MPFTVDCSTSSAHTDALAASPLAFVPTAAAQMCMVLRPVPLPAPMCTLPSRGVMAACAGTPQLADTLVMAGLLWHPRQLSETWLVPSGTCAAPDCSANVKEPANGKNRRKKKKKKKKGYGNSLPRRQSPAIWKRVNLHGLCSV